jgi:hypothetical protein
MSATPRAKNEYSRGSGVSGGDSGGSLGGPGPPFGRRTDLVDRGSGGLILVGALLAALLLIVAEFTALYQFHIATSSVPLKSVSGGANHSYAMLLIGLAAAGLGLAVWQSGSRPALLALGILGVVALLIALLGDLSDAQATGLYGSAAHGYVNASNTPSAGLYLETLGAVILIATCGLGFMLLGVSVSGTRPRPRRPGRDGGGQGSRAPGTGASRRPRAPQLQSRRRRSGPEGPGPGAGA